MGRGRHFLGFLLVVLVAFSIGLSFQFVVVRGTSMEPTCHDGDFLICTLSKEISRGDIVVLKDNMADGLLCKRVIALAGDEVTLHGNRVNVNDYLVQEPYLYTQEWTSGFNGVVPSNSIYVLGDNRVDSRDSRDFGYVPVSSIKGVMCYNVTKSLGVSYKIIQRSIVALLFCLLAFDVLRLISAKFGRLNMVGKEG